MRNTTVTPAVAPRHNLPVQVTSFVGREREVVEVGRLLAAERSGSRLLTLVGPGGIGKTRLALCVAAEALPDYPDGVWLAELAALADPALVLQAVASAVGVREVPGRALAESVQEALRRRTLLLVLDNCEHVVDAAARLADALLRHCPRLRILATSREPLGSAGETAWRVPPLGAALPSGTGEARPCGAEGATPAGAGGPPAEGDAGGDAVRLFVERARVARPGFVADEANAPLLDEICRRLDGIPLAIELAAARLRAFSVQQVAARLDDRFRLLTAGPRTALPHQQTLRATLDWSYVLLSEPERALLRRLAAFAGGWTLEGAEAVAAGGGIHAYAVLDLLAGLVDKSLVSADEARGAVRYRLLETIRQYADERLREAGETERTRDAHLAYFLRLAEEAGPLLRGPAAQAAMDGLEEEHDNLRAALERGLATEGEVALRLSGALAWFWWGRAYHGEGRRWLTRALARSPARTAARMRALSGAGWLAHHQRDATAAREGFEESLAIARQLGDRGAQTWALHGLGRVAYYEGDGATARALGRESLAVAEEVGDGWLVAWALHLLGLAAHIEADYPTARSYYERSLAIRRELGYEEGAGILLTLLGIVAMRQGALSQAQTLHREALETMRGLLGSWAISVNLANFSGLAAALGQPERAVRLAGASAALRESRPTPLIPLAEAVLEEGLQRAKMALGEGAYATAWEQGRAMSLEESIAEALSLRAPGAAPPAETGAPAGAAGAARARARSGGGALAGLTPAEVQVLRLLANGRTTKEIAAELAIAVSTAERHITHIYGKLGVRNRAEATSLALRHGPL